MAEAAPQEPWWRRACSNVLFLLFFFALLALIFFFIWLFIFPLRALGDWLFIALPRGQYLHLNTNQVLNQPGFLLPLLFWVLALFNVPSDWLDGFRKLPKRDKAKRRQKLAQLNRRCCRLLAMSAGLSVLLSLPAMRSYIVVAGDGIHDMDFYRRHETVYPFSQLECIRKSVVRGAIFYDFYFDRKEDDSFTAAGLNPQALAWIEYQTGKSFQSWMGACGGWRRGR
ncbi:hypothetical protein AAFM71_19900 [Chromobacterium violaceum]|uniref:hypothetical protein n=1 Tax=Chromobacterium violaceum TaxID=536 RepID=UPI001124E319|nr:hypothetical protein [Chromobacterium violaceum]MBA8734888.1 hypothetical protein [Chromobacterium violaceum]